MSHRRLHRLYTTFYVTHGYRTYAVDCRVEFWAAPRVGRRSSPLGPSGSPPRVRVLRILRDRIDVTEDLIAMTRAAIHRDVLGQAAARYARSAAGPARPFTSFLPPAPSFEARGQPALAETPQ